MNRIDTRFQQLRREQQKGFVAYITAGDPSLRATSLLAKSFEKIGVDVLELGVPFSDPLADGVVNQLAAERALRSGTTLHKILQTVKRLRDDGCEMPIVLFTYFNPLHAYGLARFVGDAVDAGVDGILPLDLPPEEEVNYRDALCESSLRLIHLIAPTTPEPRIKDICRRSSGFIYYVSREGVTGMRKQISTAIEPRISLIRKYTRIPIAIGFGVSTPEQARTVAQWGDAVVIGSAIVTRIGKRGNDAALVPRVSKFVKSLVDSVKKR